MKNRYYPKIGLIVFIGIFIFSIAAVCRAEEITLTTYYPSPYGVYSEMRLFPKSSSTTPCANGNPNSQPGVMFYDSVENVLKVCVQTGPNAFDWQRMGGGFWAASPSNPNNIYNTNSGNVGIGTGPATAALEKLDVSGSAHFSGKLKTGNLSVVDNIISVAGGTETGGFAVGFNNGSGVLIAKNPALTGPGVGIFGPSGSPAIGMGGDTLGLGYIEAYLGRDLQLKTRTLNSVIYMQDSTGRVGIGTTNPLYSLDVVSNSALGAILVREPAANLQNNNARFAALGFGTGIGGNNQAGVVIGIPGKSWDLLADSAQGNSFGVVEYLGGNNWSHRLTVRPGGNVGIGTTNPGANLHVMGTMGCQFPGAGPWGGDLFHVAQEGNRPVVRIRDDDGLSNPVLQFAKNNLWMNLEFNGDTITIGGAGPVSRVRISNISIGGALPGYVASYPYETIGMDPGNNLRVNFGSFQKYVFFNSGYAEAVAGGGWGIASDRRFKEDVVELANVMQALKNIRGVRFSWKTKEFPQKGLPEGRQIGLIAQEVEQEFPELVATDPDGYKSLDYGKLTPVLIEAVKEQQKQLEGLKAENEALKARLDVVEQKLK